MGGKKKIRVSIIRKEELQHEKQEEDAGNEEAEGE